MLVCKLTKLDYAKRMFNSVTAKRVQGHVLSLGQFSPNW